MSTISLRCRNRKSRRRHNRVLFSCVAIDGRFFIDHIAIYLIDSKHMVNDFTAPPPNASVVATSPEEHLVTALPGLKDGDFSTKQYAGHIPVEDGFHFYWLFESASADPSSDPLVIWLNGGPVREEPVFGVGWWAYFFAGGAWCVVLIRFLSRFAPNSFPKERCHLENSFLTNGLLRGGETSVALRCSLEGVRVLLAPTLRSPVTLHTHHNTDTLLTRQQHRCTMKDVARKLDGATDHHYYCKKSGSVGRLRAFSRSLFDLGHPSIDAFLPFGGVGVSGATGLLEHGRTLAGKRPFPTG